MASNFKVDTKREKATSTLDAILDARKQEELNNSSDVKFVKAQNKKIIKEAQSKKTISLAGAFDGIIRSIGLSDDKFVPEQEEVLALLCDKMHFDGKEAYKLLRTNVLFSLPDDSKCRTVGITSPVRGEGKSTVAINLAYTIAETGAKVLLLDMDLRLPSITKKLEMPKTKGLSDYLIGGASINEICHTSKKFNNWTIMEAGSIPPSPSELIGSENMKNLIKQLEKKYDFIIIDLPPVNIVSDALVANDIVDGYLLVARQGFSDKHSMANCLRQLNFLNAHILGFVMTDAQGGVGYGKNKYYKKYKKHYGYYKKYGYNKYGYESSGKQ